MFNRITRSFDLLKASATVLKADRHLLVFPLISGVALVMVLACFALPLFGMGAFDGIRSESDVTPVLYSAAFLFYVVQYFVIFYCNAALVGCVLMRLDGGAPTVKDGLRIANSRFGAILGYAVIAATVGMILRAIEERVGFLGRWITALVGAGWTLATFLVVPVLVARDAGAIASVKESAGMFKRTWGENVAGQAGLGIAFSIIQLGLIAAGGIAIAVFIAVFKLPVLALLMIVLTVFAVLATLLFHSALTGIYSAVLYRYASTGDAATGFDNGVLGTAFLPKK
ncbi:DUF6159 family protein [Massilia sp. R2A-15]|uniref:DUF6159 family protein n=1 Tax=Massilia sp. R2A-15 TaxID=3064278 RepID=UPI0027323BF2|nr:DUF6159 family protein [Massilia sp. R2A-15]WLI87614.1 DUF6159 family protein [Massilia sp. R2A-15]